MQKIAIRLDKSDSPMAAIVGSSNLTGPAYREGWGNWNYECDVTIWRADSALTDHFKAINDTSQIDIFDRILVKLDPEVEQPDEDERLIVLYKDVLREKEEFVSLEHYEP